MVFCYFARILFFYFMEKLGIQRNCCWSFKTDFYRHEKQLVDDIIPEPLGGAHYDKETTFKTVQEYIMKSFNKLKDLSTSELVSQRMLKYSKMGEFKVISYNLELLLWIFFDSNKISYY
jgi:hypothetical protein